jgi:hypothetical protein
LLMINHPKHAFYRLLQITKSLTLIGEALH